MKSFLLILHINNICQIESHSQRNLITVCFAAKCKGKRVCCSLCLTEFHKDHIETMVDFQFLLKFIQDQSQKPNISSPKVMQVIQVLNNVLKNIYDLTKLIKEEILRFTSANLNTFCKNLENHYNLYTECIGNQKWNDLAQEMLQYVELKVGEIIEKDFFVTPLGKPYLHFMKQFSLTLTKMVDELMFSNKIMNSNEGKNSLVIDQNKNKRNSIQILKDQNDSDPNPFLKLTELDLLKGHTKLISAIDLCEQRNLIVSGSQDSTVKLWNLQDNYLRKTYKASSSVYDVVFSSSGSFLAYGGQSEIITLIKIKDSINNDIVSELKGHNKSVIRLSFSICQSYLISGSFDHSIRVWNIMQRQGLFKLQTGSTVCGLAMSRDNQLIVSHSYNTGIKIWDFKSQRCLCTQQGHRNGSGIIFSNNEEQLISSGNDGKIKVWSLLNLKYKELSLIKEFCVAKNEIQKVLLTSDSRFILLYCLQDMSVKVIDSNTGREVELFKLNKTYAQSQDFLLGSIAITKNMNFVAYIDGNEVVVWVRK